MTVIESNIRKIIIEYGFVKRFKEYPFLCLVIPKPVMDTLCERLARMIEERDVSTINAVLDHKEKEIKP